MNEYFDNSLEMDSKEMDQIKTAVREAGVFIVLGYSERYRGTIYIAQVSVSISNLNISNQGYFYSLLLTPLEPSFITAARSSPHMWRELTGETVKPTL